jgi:hypothetical protein
VAPAAHVDVYLLVAVFSWGVNAHRVHRTVHRMYEPNCVSFTLGAFERQRDRRRYLPPTAPILDPDAVGRRGRTVADLRAPSTAPLNLVSPGRTLYDRGSISLERF